MHVHPETPVERRQLGCLTGSQEAVILGPGLVTSVGRQSLGQCVHLKVSSLMSPFSAPCRNYPHWILYPGFKGAYCDGTR
jgi:hypothetical protein